MTIRGRFAPSPTGDLHLGNARTAILAWLQARSAGGRFVLRMEDLDPGRVRPEYLRTQLLDLRWLGLDWDEGPDLGGPHAPYLQSQRSERYQLALAELDSAGLLYPCFCSRKEIAAAASAPHRGEGDGPPYPGTCRERARQIGSPSSDQAVRFRVPPGEVRFSDLLRGSVAFHPAAEVGDFVVRRKDGVAGYQLAVVVDDAAMEITDVLRGGDLLSSTARQILLYQALGLAAPRWIHVPLLRGPDGERLAKRHGALSLRQLREGGVPPERVVGWLAFTCGLAGAGEEVGADGLLARFDPGRIPREDTAVRIPDWLTVD